MRRIVIAVDLKEDSKKAVGWTIENVTMSEDEVHVVHVAKLKVLRCFMFPSSSLLPSWLDDLLAKTRFPEAILCFQMLFLCRMKLLNCFMVRQFWPLLGLLVDLQ